MHRSLRIIAWIVGCLIAVQASADTLSDVVKNGVLKIGMEAGYMPFEMRAKKGDLIGFDVDLATMMAKEMGVKVEFVNTEWDGIIPALLTGKFDFVMSGMTATPERNLKVNFSQPYMVVGQTVILRKGLLGDKIKTLADLNHDTYSVASRLGTTGEQAIKKFLSHAKYKAYQTEQDAALEVVSGKVDAFVYDHPYNAIFAGSKGKGKVDFMDKPFTYEPIAIGMRRGDVDALNWINNFVDLIKKDGRLERLEQKWFKETDWLEKVQ